MPVSNTSVLGSRFTKSGRLRWIGQRSVALLGAPLSIVSPTTLKTRPRQASPTGTATNASASAPALPAGAAAVVTRKYSSPGAVTSAAGLSKGGLHPVVALYATFLNRAFDQVLMDVALHKQGVTFVLDRAGVTGDDPAPGAISKIKRAQSSRS